MCFSASCIIPKQWFNAKQDYRKFKSVPAFYKYLLVIWGKAVLCVCMWLNACNVSIYKYWEHVMCRKSKVGKCHILDLFTEVLQCPWESCIKQCLRLLVYRLLFQVLGSEEQARNLLCVSGAESVLLSTSTHVHVGGSCLQCWHLLPLTLVTGAALKKEECWVPFWSLTMENTMHANTWQLWSSLGQFLTSLGSWRWSDTWTTTE